MPISASQDTAGPMGRTVTDVAMLLGAMAGVDPADTATAGAAAHVAPDYTKALIARALRAPASAWSGPTRGSMTAVDALMGTAMDLDAPAGAVIVDPVTVPRTRTSTGTRKGLVLSLRIQGRRQCLFRRARCGDPRAVARRR